MKKFTLVLTFLVFLFSNLVIAAPVRVMIDPGHGGDDEGAAFGDVKEKEITLNVAKKLLHILSRDRNFVPYITRTNDEFIPLSVRNAKAESAHAEVFISIHANSSPVASARGTEFYFENQVATDEETQLLANRENTVKNQKGQALPDEKTDVESILTDLNHNEHMMMSQHLSQNLLESFQKNMKIKTRAIRQAPFRVLSVTMPATLIELGFISNEKEAHWLAEDSNQEKMAHTIYKGLKTFKEKLDKVRQSAIN
jgi:N-acetylmuramoyl-L-alanine amidase